MTTDIHIPFLDDAVDFVKLAEAMGAKAIRVTKMEEVEPAIRRGAGISEEPVVLDCMDRSGSQRIPDGAGRRKSLMIVFDEEDMKNNEQSV